MKNIAQLNREKAAKAKELRALLATVETRAEKTMTAAEKTQFETLATECERRQEEIDQEIRTQDIEKKATAEKNAKDPAEIRSFGEFLQDVATGGAGLETRDLAMKTGKSMGFAVPEQFDSAIRMIEMPNAIIRPRSTVIPAGSPPDARITLNALNQSGSKGIYGGVTVTWIDENAAIADAGDPEIRQVSLEPKQVSAYIDVSDKLMDNAPAVGGLVQQLLRGAILGAEEDAFWANGSGVGKPLCVIGCPGSKEHTRAVASQISYTDVVNMYAKFKFGGSPVFVASQTTLPQLMTLADANGNTMWQPSAREGAPNMLMGFPLVLNDQSPALGTTGDLALVDLKWYYIKDGSSLAIMINPYSNMGNRLTRIYAYWNVDGQPFITTPLTLRDGVTTVSPFVVLKSA
jgi:HK97 family phage major capsid protein